MQTEHPAGNLPTEEKKVEYDELVAFYKKKLRERYLQCDPERRRIMELLQHADEETLSRVSALLNEKQEEPPCSRQ